MKLDINVFHTGYLKEFYQYMIADGDIKQLLAAPFKHCEGFESAVYPEENLAAVLNRLTKQPNLALVIDLVDHTKSFVTYTDFQREFLKNFIINELFLLRCMDAFCEWLVIHPLSNKNLLLDKHSQKFDYELGQVTFLLEGSTLLISVNIAWQNCFNVWSNPVARPINIEIQDRLTGEFVGVSKRGDTLLEFRHFLESSLNNYLG